MGSIRTAGAAAVLAAGLLLQKGCQTRRQPATREPAQPSLSASQRLREELLRADPNARVGIVSSALHDAQLVAVRDVPVEGFAEGDTIAFLDGNGRPLTQGTVERVMNGAVHVRYATGGARAPNVGDLAVRSGGPAAGAAPQGATDGNAGAAPGAGPGDAGMPGGANMAGGAAPPPPATGPGTTSAAPNENEGAAASPADGAGRPKAGAPPADNTGAAQPTDATDTNKAPAPAEPAEPADAKKAADAGTGTDAADKDTADKGAADKDAAEKEKDAAAPDAGADKDAADKHPTDAGKQSTDADSDAKKGDEKPDLNK